jgi:hypothetical protein
MPYPCSIVVGRSAGDRDLSDRVSGHFGSPALQFMRVVQLSAVRRKFPLDP